MEIQATFEEINYNELHFREIVGRGAFGTVHRALWHGVDVAVKLIETENERRAFITELKQLSRISHPNIVRLYGACTKQPVCLVMEYAEEGSLYNVLHASQPHLRPKYTVAHALSWALQCARGVEYMHGMKPKPLIHRDLKPPNLLLVSGGTVLKICDFGTACDAHTHMTNNKGSAAWMAPEVFEGCTYSEKCDVFSWGIILWEVITRKKPFEEIGGAAFCVMWAVHNGKRPPLVKDCPKPLETLMTRCWSSNPMERPSMTEVVRIMTRLSQFFHGEDQPLIYPARDSSEERPHPRTPGSHLQVLGREFDSQYSTMRETVKQPGAAGDGELVTQLMPVTPPQKPVVFEDGTGDLKPTSARRTSWDLPKPVINLPSSEQNRNLPFDVNDAGPPPKPPVRTHRRTGSHGATPVSSVQQPFVPGHRRTGSYGNTAVTSAGTAGLSVGPLLPSVTTAPGNLEDIERLVQHTMSSRSVSWTPGPGPMQAVPSGIWPHGGSGSVEDIGDNSLNFIDQQLKPVSPCQSCPESMDIYNQHLKMIDEFLQVQAEIIQLEQRKEFLIQELKVDEKERQNQLKLQYESLLTDNEELKLLYTNCRKQAELLKTQRTG